MAEAPARLALVGCGRLAEVGYLPAFRRAKGVKLGAVVEPDAERRARLGRDIASASTLAALLDRERLDGVVLASPSSTHLDDARRAAAHGLPALIEKPPAPDAQGAAALAALDPLPWIGFNRRFDPGVQRLRSTGAAVSAKPAGHHLDLQLFYRRRAWGAHVAHDDALLDLGPHLVDLARWLGGGEIVRLRPRRIDPHAAELELDLGTASARVRCANNRRHRERFAIGSGQGRRLVHPMGGSFGAAHSLLARAAGRGAPHPLVVSLAGQLEAFGRGVRGEEAWPLATAADGVAAMAVVDAARAAGGSDQWVEVAWPIGSPRPEPAPHA